MSKRSIQEFSIAGNNYRVISNFETKNLLFEPQPYNLYINYFIQPLIKKKKYHIISILNNDKKLHVRTVNAKLMVTGDISPMFSEGYNPQFGIFGNKGLINRFILHNFESLSKIHVLHACAIIHPKNGEVCIAVGSSGAGKSVFISNALKVGWKLIASEHVAVDLYGNLFKGNQFDNVSPKALDFIEKYLNKAVIFENKKLVEPIGSKIFIDFSKYGADQSVVTINNNNLTLVVLNFGNDFHKSGSRVDDTDFMLRTLQHSASEKICSPIIFDDKILNLNLNGSPANRSSLVGSLMNLAKENIILGGDYVNFEAWLRKKYEN